jgi:hypothetical protein
MNIRIQLILFSVLGIICNISAQTYKIEDIKYNPDNLEFSNFTYPKIVLENSVVAERINAIIKEKTLDHWIEVQGYDTSFVNVIDEIKFLEKHLRLTSYSYEVIFSKQNLLSIQTYIEICDRRIWHIDIRLNFDANIGKLLTIQDITNENKINELKHVLSNESWLRLFISEIQNEIITNPNNLDNDEIKILKKSIEEAEYCLEKEMEINDFLIRDNALIFYDNCEFSELVENVCTFPNNDRYNNQKEKMKSIIKEEYYKIIFNQ